MRWTNSRREIYIRFDGRMRISSGLAAAAAAEADRGLWVMIPGVNYGQRSIAITEQRDEKRNCPSVGHSD